MEKNAKQHTNIILASVKRKSLSSWNAKYKYFHEVIHEHILSLQSNVYKQPL